jgi:pyruvate kinase
MTAATDAPPDDALPSTLTPDELLAAMERLHTDMTALEGASAAPLAEVSSEWGVSGRNLLHYLALRRHDLRPIQHRLAELGLSSLGRSEAATLATVEAVIGQLHRVCDRPPPAGISHVPMGEARRLLADHAVALLGRAPAGRHVRIMVTMPGAAADDYLLIRDLLGCGMDCMRINCAHDGPDAWAKMIAHLRRAEREVGRSCRVLMDLCGPKIRTGPLPPGPRVVKVRPSRDDLGRVITPAAVWLTPADHPGRPVGPVDAVLPVAADWLARLTPGGEIVLRDARGARRVWAVETVTPDGCRVTTRRTCYVATGTRLRTRGDGPKADRTTAVGELPEKAVRLDLRAGDTLTVRRGGSPGRVNPPEIGCTLDEVFRAVEVGQPIWFDDGKIGGVIRSTAADRFDVEITRTPPGGGRLAADKGINLPDTALPMPALTPKDLSDLRFVAANADLVGYSFVRDGKDVRELQARLAETPARTLGIVLKIETKRAFENLPEMLLTAMRTPAVGVMIARGDLAVECGFERLAEVQEEILWLCEAAHVPVVWATQVLENLAKFGQPSRAEITDAAMSERAECVMLNKGPHVRDAVRLLDDILRRMQAHQSKKRSMLRLLGVAVGFAPGRHADPGQA